MNRAGGPLGEVDKDAGNLPSPLFRDSRKYVHGAVGPRAIVASGTVDQLFIDEMRTIARVVAYTRPPPTGASAWSDQDIDDLVFDTVERVDPGALVLAAQQANNDAMFRSWLRVAVRTTLDLRARKTPAGRVIRAVDDALREDSAGFELVDGYWRLRGDVRSPHGSGDTRSLVQLAWTVETSTVRISSDAAKTPPLAHRRDIRSVCASVLEHSGPLRKVDLAEVVAHRFNVSFEDRFDYLDLESEDRPEPATARETAAFDEVDDDAAAEWMLSQLTADEAGTLRLIVGGASIRDLAVQLECTNYRAELLRDRVVEKLRLLANTMSGDDGERVTERLLAVIGRHDELRHSRKHDGGEHVD